MHDAHYHYSKEINALQNEYGISGICNVANEKEFELKIIDNKFLSGDIKKLTFEEK